MNLLTSNQVQSKDSTSSQSLSTTHSPANNTLDDLANLATLQSTLPASQTTLPSKEVDLCGESCRDCESCRDYDTIKTPDALPTLLVENTDTPFTTYSAPDDEINLQIFKTELIWYFPFIVIPPDTNAETLRQQKPFLFRTIILSVTHHQKSMQKEGWKEVVDHLSLHLLFKGEKSFDLLQGLVS